MELKDLTKIVPSNRQLMWQQLEFYGFIHFGMNTMTDSEWGDGQASVDLFQLENLDTDAWIESMKMAEMKAVILTCKHHDGFCLWPSAYTDYSIKATNFASGKGDIVKQVAESCQKYGLKFGVYLSPWDRHDASYGKGDAYNDYYVNQLTELLTNYGDIFCVWLDGANGEGANGKVQEYDWERYYQTVRSLQPQAVISICGPDVRWCGNEAGVARKEEWSVVPKTLTLPQHTIENSQQEDEGEFSRTVPEMAEDLGSREKVLSATSLAWYPCEVDTSIRTGWFYHESDDETVRSAQDLFTIYKQAVGGNSSLLLNVPPTPQGNFHELDNQALKGLGKKIRQFYTQSCSREFEVGTSSGNFTLGKTWRSDLSDECPSLTISLPDATDLCGVLLQEDITDSQRIESFEIYADISNDWVLLSIGTTVGYKKIVEFDKIQTKQLKIIFKAFREYPTLKDLAVLKVIEPADEV